MRGQSQRLRGRALQRLRAQVFAAYGNVCHLCEQPIDMRLSGRHRWGPTIDHIIPHAHGGPDTVANCRPAHHACNSSAGAAMGNRMRGDDRKRGQFNPSREW